MWMSTRKTRSREPSSEPPIIYTDGGSGLLEACEARFPKPHFEVSCDAQHSVWVKRVSGSCSYGLAPWLLRSQSIDQVLAGAEAKLAQPEVSAPTKTACE